MISYGMCIFPIACVVAATGAVFYGAGAWLHITVTALSALCWVTRRIAYDGVVRLACTVGLSGGTFALAVGAIMLGVSGMVEAAAMSFACATLSGIAASTQVGPARRFISDIVMFIRNRTM